MYGLHTSSLYLLLLWIIPPVWRRVKAVGTSNGNAPNSKSFCRFSRVNSHQSALPLSTLFLLTRRAYSVVLTTTLPSQLVSCHRSTCMQCNPSLDTHSKSCSSFLFVLLRARNAIMPSRTRNDGRIETLIEYIQKFRDQLQPSNHAFWKEQANCFIIVSVPINRSLEWYIFIKLFVRQYRRTSRLKSGSRGDVICIKVGFNY